MLQHTSKKCGAFGGPTPYLQKHSWGTDTQGESLCKRIQLSQQQHLERLLPALCEAALDDAHWLSAAALLNEAVGTRGHALTFATGRSQHDATLFFLRFCFGDQHRQDYEQTYLTDYWHRDERVPRWAALLDGDLVHTPSLYTEPERKHSIVYKKLLSDLQARNGLNVRLDGPAGSHVLWTLADSSESTGWGAEQIKIIERLRPHIRQFMCVRQAMVDAGALGTSLSALLDNTGICTIQLDRHGRVAAANDAAREVLRRREGLFAPDGFLRATIPAADTELQGLVASAIPPGSGPGVGGSMAIRGRSPSTTFLLHVHPVEAEVRDGRAHRVAALVLVVNPRAAAQVDPDLVAIAFGLTRAESQVATMLAAGHTVGDIASLTGRKEGSVHWHLQKIFRKQGITRQAELVRRVLSLATLPESR